MQNPPYHPLPSYFFTAELILKRAPTKGSLHYGGKRTNSPVHTSYGRLSSGILLNIYSVTNNDHMKNYGKNTNVLS